MIAVELVDDAKDGNTDKFAKDDARWTENIRAISKFLAGANPNWPERDVMDLLALHLELTKDEVTARLNKDWNAAIQAFDDIFTEILVLADTLHDGLVAQFPEKFGTQATPARLGSSGRKRFGSRPISTLGSPGRPSPACSGSTGIGMGSRASMTPTSSSSSSRRTAVRR